MKQTDKRIPLVLHVPPQFVRRLQQIAQAACAGVPPPRMDARTYQSLLPAEPLVRTPLPYLPPELLDDLRDEREVEIAARLLDRVSLRIDKAAKAARESDEGSVDADDTPSPPMVESSEKYRYLGLPEALRRADGKDSLRVDAIWRLLGKHDVLERVRLVESYAYCLGSTPKQAKYSFDEMLGEALKNWRKLRRPASAPLKPRPRLLR